MKATILALIRERILQIEVAKQEMLGQVERNERKIAVLNQENQRLAANINGAIGAIIEFEKLLNGEEDGEDTVDPDRPGRDNGDPQGPCDSDRAAGDEEPQESLPVEE